MFEPYHLGTGWSKKNAAVLACLSEIAYLPKKEAMQKVSDLSDRPIDFVWFEKNDTQAFLCNLNGATVLVYRGTESIGDWMTDLDIVKTKGPAGTCHSGFLKAFIDTWDEVLPHIGRDGHSPIWIAGHSLGGALATLSVADLLWMGIQVEGLYTFGCPRVGDQEFCNFINAKMGHRARRFVNNNDVVPRIPQRIFGYDHYDHVMHFGEDGTLHEDGLSWLALLEDRLSGRIHDILSPGTDGMKDHFMSNYKNLLERLNA